MPRRENTLVKKRQQLEKAQADFDAQFKKVQTLAMECDIWKKIVQKDRAIAKSNQQQEQVILFH